MDIRPATYYRPIDIERMEFVADLIPIGSRVLDVGSYDGEFAQHTTSTVTCVDLHPKKMSRVIPADIYHLPFKTGAFDCVVAMEVLEHLTDYWRAIWELCRVSNSTLIISVPNDEVPLGEGHMQRLTGKMLDKRVRVIFDNFGDENRVTCEQWHIGKRMKYYGVQLLLAKIDMSLLRLVSRVWGIKKREGPTWLVARFTRL